MSHGYNANFRNSGQPNQTLVFGGGFQGNANPLPVVLNPFQAIANIVCGDTLSSTINVQSFSSFFRTSNLFTNQSYKARLFTSQIDTFGGGNKIHLKFVVTTSSFTPFITLFRSQDFRVVSSDGSGVLEADVTVDTEGPFQVEVTTVNPGELGDFTLAMTCYPSSVIYPFEGNADDVIGGVNGGILGPIDFVPGKIGQAMRFPSALGGFGTSQFFVDISSLAPYSGGGVSHAFWIKLETLDTGWFVVVVLTDFNGNDGHEYQFGMAMGQSFALNNPQFFLKQDPSGSATIVASVTVPITWVTGVWHLLVLTYDQVSGAMKASVDGGAYTSGTTFSLPNGTWNAIENLGGLYSLLAYPRTVLDEYLLTTGYALTDADIAFIYNSGAGQEAPYRIPTPPQ